MKLRSFLLLSLLFVLASCGSGGGGSDETPEIPPQIVNEAPNPIASTQTFGENGNLYKPRSEEDSSGTGNVVVLLSPQFTKQFDSCQIRKSSGEWADMICINDQPWTHVPYSCFSNGGRQTWRANFKCDDVAEVRVVCRDLNQEVTFTVPDAARGWICTRFG